MHFIAFPSPKSADGAQFRESRVLIQAAVTEAEGILERANRHAESMRQQLAADAREEAARALTLQRATLEGELRARLHRIAAELSDCAWDVLAEVLGETLEKRPHTVELRLQRIVDSGFMNTTLLERAPHRRCTLQVELSPLDRQSLQGSAGEDNVESPVRIAGFDSVENPALSRGEIIVREIESGTAIRLHPGEHLTAIRELCLQNGALQHLLRHHADSPQIP